MADLTDREILLGLVGIVNDAGVLGATARLDYLDATAPAASVQQLIGSRWSERYVDGSGIREQPFAVLYRTDANDTAGRADAASALMELADTLGAMTESDLSAPIIRITCQTTPSLVERSEDGSEVWQDEYLLESRRSI